MAKEDKKDFNAMLYKDTGMPKIQIITDEKTIEKCGGNKLFFAPPVMYDEIMKRVPEQKLITTGLIREYLAKKNNADFTDPMTAGIFVLIAAWASYQRTENKTPYWRTLKANGELNAKFPGGIASHKAQLEAEGHEIIEKGKKNIKYFVKDYKKFLFDLK